MSSDDSATASRNNDYTMDTSLKRDHSSAVFFDTDAQIDDMEPFDYFDAMEVLYFEDMMHEKMPPLRRLKKGLSMRVEEEQARLRKAAMQRRTKLEKSIHKRRKKMREAMREPGFVMTIDKVSFVMGILTIMVTEGVLLVAPDKIGLLYTVLLFPLMILRYLLYRMERLHYFMYDFCYFCQILLLLQLYKWPGEAFLRINFCLTNGPLAMATVMWRNSLVFHSMDKMTSSFIHMLPPLVTFAIKWQEQLLSREFPFWQELDANNLIRDYMVYPFGVYAFWQGLYLVKTEIISKHKLMYNTEIMTSLRWLTRNPGSASYKIINCFGEKHQLASYVMCQGIYTILTMLPMPLLWHSMQLHALYLVVIFLVALTNGAAYYFHVFAVRYMDKLGGAKKGETTNFKQEEKGE